MASPSTKRAAHGRDPAERSDRTGSHLHIDVVIPIPTQPAQRFATGQPTRPHLPRRFHQEPLHRPHLHHAGPALRKKSVRQKLNPIAIEFAGKNVLLVDDSIVRGTTSKEIVQMAREPGAQGVLRLRRTTGALPNVYGIDMPTRENCWRPAAPTPRLPAKSAQTPSSTRTWTR